MSEDEVFDQEMSEDELVSVVGAGGLTHKSMHDGCTGYQLRDIYDGGFPNCAASVEDGSYCMNNDACLGYAVKYGHMETCYKAWE